MPYIRAEITKGVFWIALAKYSGVFISLGVTAILARNISPAAFGTMTVATVIMAFLDIFVDMGIGPAIVQFKDLTKRQINSLFMIGGVIGLLLSIILFLAANPIASYYKDETLINVCRLLCVCMLFNALNIVPNALMMKSKRFKTVAIRTLVFQVGSGTAAVFAALNGWGIYALIISPIITSIGVFGFNYYNYPQSLIIKIEWSAIRKVWSFSSFQFLFAFTNYFSRNLDKLIIGKYFSLSQLGYYDKSYRLMQMPLQYITFVIGPVLHPVLSSLQDNRHELGEKNKKLLTILSQISFPLGLILYFCAPEIISIIFGPDWEPSVPIFQILALSLPLQILLSTSGSLYQAAGRTDHLFYVGICNTIVTVSGFLIAALRFKTIEAIAWAWDITLMINFCSSYIVMNKITFGYSVRSFFKVFIPQIINSGITAVVAYALIRMINIDNEVVSAMIKMIIVVIPTIIFAIFFHQYNIFSLIRSMLVRSHKKL